MNRIDVKKLRSGPQYPGAPPSPVTIAITKVSCPKVFCRTQRLVRLVRGGSGSNGGQPMVRLLKREAGSGADSADRAAASRYMNMRTL